MEAYVKILMARRVLREEMNEQNLLSFRQAFNSVFHKEELFRCRKREKLISQKLQSIPTR